MSRIVIRFVTHSTHPPFGHRTGVFKAASMIRGTLAAQPTCAAELAEQLEWFEANLAEPTRFSTSRHPRARETAVSWVKERAREQVRRLRLLVALVEETGDVRIDELRTERPGYIVFEDGHQVVALPFADTPH
jgi:hypothetical protein